MELRRKNINRGFTKLRVWEDSIELFDFVFKIIDKKEFPDSLFKVKSNILDASHSVSRNISEGYCRRNLKEYLNFLNISLGSMGELFSGMLSLKKIKVINDAELDKFDEIHFKTENGLISLIKSLQKKQKEGNWQSSFIE